jgi:hypothetical protein
MKRRLSLVFAITLLGATAPSIAQTAPGIALVIGNAAYPDAEAPLKESVGDARSLSDELRRRGFEVELGENLSKEAMQRALERLYAKIVQNSTAVIFFSGYGIQSNRQTYLVPVNAQIWSETDVRRDGFNLDAVLSEMNSKGASIKIAILDASRRNPFERRFRSHSAGLAAITAPKASVVVSSATPGSVVDDGAPGLFMTELLKELRVPGATIEQIFNRTRMNVSRASGRRQVPSFSSSLEDDVVFAASSAVAATAGPDVTPTVTRPAATYTPAPISRPTTTPPTTTPLTTPPATATPAAPTTTLSDPDATARRDFSLADTLGTRQGWEDFLRKHPWGSYANQARDQLNRLSTQTQQSAVVTSSPSDDPAIRDLNEKIRLSPHQLANRYRRGQLYAQKGDFARARDDFDEVIRLSPEDPEAHNNRCWARAMLSDFEGALRDCNQALKLRPDFVDALDSRGLVELKLGLYTEAMIDYDAALRIQPRLASALYGRGIARLRRGSTAGGNKDIAAAKAIKTDIAEEFASYGIR